MDFEESHAPDEAISSEEQQCIDRFQQLVLSNRIRALALDFDETITRQGFQRGASAYHIHTDDDTVVLDNVRHPAFLRALIYAIHAAGGRVCVVSFQDDFVSNPEVGVVAGRELVLRYMDALLGRDRPSDMVTKDHDLLLWNPMIRCAATQQDLNKNQHLRVLATFSGRRDPNTSALVAAPKLLPESIIYIDDSYSNVAAANAANVARGYVATDGVNASLCDHIVKTITLQNTGSTMSTHAMTAEATATAMAPPSGSFGFGFGQTPPPPLPNPQLSAYHDASTPSTHFSFATGGSFHAPNLAGHTNVFGFANRSNNNMTTNANAYTSFSSSSTWTTPQPSVYQFNETRPLDRQSMTKTSSAATTTSSSSASSHPLSQSTERLRLGRLYDASQKQQRQQQNQRSHLTSSSPLPNS